RRIPGAIQKGGYDGPRKVTALLAGPLPARASVELKMRGKDLDDYWRATAASTGAQLSPTTRVGWNTTLRGAGGALLLMRPTSIRKASLIMSLIGCSVRGKGGRRPLIPGMVSVEAIEMSSGQRRPRSAIARMAPSAITPLAT